MFIYVITRRLPWFHMLYILSISIQYHILLRFSHPRQREIMNLIMAIFDKFGKFLLINLIMNDIQGVLLQRQDSLRDVYV